MPTSILCLYSKPHLIISVAFSPIHVLILLLNHPTLKVLWDSSPIRPCIFLFGRNINNFVTPDLQVEKQCFFSILLGSSSFEINCISNRNAFQIEIAFQIEMQSVKVHY